MSHPAHKAILWRHCVEGIFDKTNRRGVNISMNGEFNGFRDIKVIKQ